MAHVHWKCVNFGDCARADAGVQNIADITDLEPRCEECGKPLVNTRSKGGGWGKKLLAAALLVVSAAMVWGAWTMLSSKQPLVRINSPLTAAGRAETPFRYEIKASGGADRFIATGLPEGLKVDPATGRIEGTPRTPGEWKVELGAFKGRQSDRRELKLTVAAGLPPTPVVERLQIEVEPGQDISAQLVSRPAADVYRVVKGAPDTVKVTPAGLVQGKMTVPGEYVFEVYASVGSGPMGKGEVAIKVMALGPPVVRTERVESPPGREFRVRLQSNPPADQYRLPPDAPKGVTLTAAGDLSGMIAERGTYRFAVLASRRGGPEQRGEVVIDVKEPTLPPVVENQRNLQFDVTDEVKIQVRATPAADRFRAGAALPAGLMLDEKTGLIVGRFKEAGQHTFSVFAARDGVGEGQGEISLTVSDCRTAYRQALIQSADLLLELAVKEVAIKQMSGGSDADREWVAMYETNAEVKRNAIAGAIVPVVSAVKGNKRTIVERELQAMFGESAGTALGMTHKRRLAVQFLSAKLSELSGDKPVQDVLRGLKEPLASLAANKG